MAYIAGVQAYGSDSTTSEDSSGGSVDDPSAPATVKLFGVADDTTRQWASGLDVTPRGSSAPSVKLEGVEIPTVDSITAGANITLTKSGAGIVVAAAGGGYSPLTTKGDVYTHDGTASARLPVGTDGHVLIADSTASTGLKWGPQSGGGGGGAALAVLIPPTTPYGISFASVGVVVNAEIATAISKVKVTMTVASGATYKIGIAPYNTGTNKITSPPIYCSTISAPVAGAGKSVFGEFSSAFSLLAGNSYLLFFVRTDSTGTVAQTVNYTTGTQTGWGASIPNTAYTATDVSPSTSTTWTSWGTGVLAISFVQVL